MRSKKFKRISKEDADIIKELFSEEEVWNAMKNCGNNKSPGPDNITFLFVKKLCGVLKNDLRKALLYFWEEVTISRGCNASFLTLIPKNRNPSSLGEFLPISYKILSKVLAERMKTLIGKIFREIQTTFVKGRFIMDEILITNEAVEFLRRSKKKGMILKVGFEKEYDCVEW